MDPKDLEKLATVELLRRLFAPESPSRPAPERAPSRRAPRKPGSKYGRRPTPRRTDPELTPEERLEWERVSAKCTRCGYRGYVLPDFGLRRSRNGYYIKQSWCKPCHGGVDYHPPDRVR